MSVSILKVCNCCISDTLLPANNRKYIFNNLSYLLEDNLKPLSWFLFKINIIRRLYFVVFCCL